MHRQPNFAADHQMRHLQEHVERIDDPAVGRVLDRHDAEIDVAAIDLLEHRRNVVHAQASDRLTEAQLDGGAQMAVTVFGTREINTILKHLFEATP